MKTLKYIFTLYTLFFLSCNVQKDKNDLGLVTYLPKGEYIIYNTGSRHIVKCLKPDGKYYWLNDVNFRINNIPGYDAHQYHDRTKIIIR